MSNGMSADKLDLAVRFKSARQRANKSQEEIAGALGIPRASVSQIESGNRDISALELHAFTVACGVPMAYFFPSADEIHWQQQAEALQGKLDRITAILREVSP